MTALKKFQRLEAGAIWRPGSAEQRRDVIVALGKASLTLTDDQDRPLAHWSLAAVERLNPGKRPAIFSPGPDAPDELEVGEPMMIDAIEKVRRAITRGGRKNGRLRTLTIAGIFVTFAGLAVIWLPDALYSRAGAMLPAPAREQVGSALLTALEPVTGKPCQQDMAVRPLRIMARKTLPEGSRLMVMPATIGILRLPGDLYLVGRELIEDFETPGILAGHLLSARLQLTDDQVTGNWLRDAGIGPTLRLLSTGDFSLGGRDIAAASMLTDDPEPVPPEQLAAAFAEAGIAPDAFFANFRMEGRATAVPASANASRPIMSDAEWVVLQSICEQ